MTRLLLNLCASLVVLFHVAASVNAQERETLYSKSPSARLNDLAKSVSNPRRDQIEIEKLPAAGRYFVRIAKRNDIFKGGDKPVADAILARPDRPFVFLTTPEGIFGKSLLEIYEDIGYEAEDIIQWQRDQDMVVILFRYPDNIKLSTVSNGKLEPDWNNRIYQTTWDNIMSLFSGLVQDNQSGPCTKPKPDWPAKRICLPSLQAQFVSGFPVEGKLRIKTTEYRVLQGVGGSDWEYRKLLEDKFSVFEHFRGDGRTENEIKETRDKPAPARLPEVVAPNMQISELAEVVIIHLGKLVTEDRIDRVPVRP